MPKDPDSHYRELKAMRAEYLGDGAYVAVREGEVLLLTSDGLSFTNTVVLDGSGARALLRFLTDLLQPPVRE